MPLPDRSADTVPGGAVVSDRGLVHQRNEDAGAVAPGIAVVCDGVSMSPDPDDASRAAVDAVLQVLTGPAEHGTGPAGRADTPAGPVAGAPGGPADGAGGPEERLAAAARAAAAAVAALGDPGHAPACTLVAATLDAGVLRVVGIGDSRAYWVPDDGPAELVTEDDSWAAGAIRAGEDPDRAWADARAHTLTSWLGADAQVPTEVRTVRLDRSGLVVLCSDGLWNYLLDPAEFGAAVRAAYAGDLLETADSLVALALDRGGRDNITVALLRHEAA